MTNKVIFNNQVFLDLETMREVMQRTFSIKPIGVVRKTDDDAWIEIFEAYTDGLLGLEGFSHIYVLYWFDHNDTPQNRQTLQVHPRKDPRNPLTGVFATHSPLRPNLIALCRCKIVSITENLIQIEDIDALDGSPVIDIKCYIPGAPEKSEVRLPDWVDQRTEDR
jgi:tRNA-Thr(GGU) m(6)t(6)A37 methyltransferase TsaA